MGADEQFVRVGARVHPVLAGRPALHEQSVPAGAAPVVGQVVVDALVEAADDLIAMAAAKAV